MSDTKRDPEKEKSVPPEASTTGVEVATKVAEPVPDEDFPDDGDFPDDDLAEGEHGRSLDDVDVRDLLRGALRPPAGSVAPALLGGVQKKLRMRSRGKFYGDGWSTAEAPKSTYLVTSALMLVLIIIVAILLVPWQSVGL
jgi:hypothetical protein